MALGMYCFCGITESLIEHSFSQGWESFLSILSEDEQTDPLKAYYNRLTSSNVVVQQEAVSIRSIKQNTSDSKGFSFRIR